MPVKTALVTGSGRGIGRGIAEALGLAQWNVVVNYAGNAAAAADAVKVIKASGAKAIAIQADVSIAEDRARLMRQTIEAFGTPDLLVNNAGVAPSVRADILLAGEGSFDRLMNINLKGPYFLTQIAAREMIREMQHRKATGGADGGTHYTPAIVTISSISAYTASPDRGDYCVAKAGLSMMTKLFAARLADENIRVYEIRPGIIQTDMTGQVKEKYDALIANGLTPIRRWGTPDDVARAVLAIASGLLPFSTGEVINVDGGFHLRRL